MNNLVSTYRFQFNSDYTFTQFEQHVDYLKKLGVKTVYASPIFEATAGSTHGYDGLNPNRINPEVGTLEQLLAISSVLKERSLFWLQDIVPNHMAFHPDNPWMYDVLEKGRLSEYASLFDVVWSSHLFQGKLMVPILADELETVLAEESLKVEIADDKIRLNYEGTGFPIGAESYLLLLSELPATDNQLFADFLLQLETAVQEENPQIFGLKWSELMIQLPVLLKHDATRALIDLQIHRFNQDKALLRQLLDYQAYAFCYWKETEHRINFRRFFTINGLICINIQIPENFELYHRLVKKLTGDGVFQGVRVDHVDGLFDPSGYLNQLRGLLGEEVPIVVEKILEKEEELPRHWPIQGTTGYDFLAQVNNLLTKQDSEEIFTRFYQELTADARGCEELLFEKKKLILHRYMGGELENLSRLFSELNLQEGEVSPSDWKKVISCFLIHCPVYRFYGNQLPLDSNERSALQAIFEEINETYPGLRAGIERLRQVLLIKPNEGDEELNSKVLEFYQRCMQFTGPLMAKGGEDTLMYTYYRFLAHNEVGDSPAYFGISISDFHQKMAIRRGNWPLALNTTSTHDTKRGEDVRARLNILSVFADEWTAKVKDWQKMNLNQRAVCQAPDSNDEYMIYQLLIGAYPPRGVHDDFFVERSVEYVRKAMREAKVHSTWENPDEAYEEGTFRFLRNLLERDSLFLADFLLFWKKVANYGLTNSLVQLTLKFTCPGVPDVYQGGEVWDFSLVDPDNRRPVDYEEREKLLQDLEVNTPRPSDLWNERENGKIKLWLTQRLCNLREQYPGLLSEGEYEPLEVQGTYKEHLMAFSRQEGETMMIVIVPLQVAKLCEEQQKETIHLDWKDTRIYLPQQVGSSWELVLQGRKANFEHFITPASLFADLPVAILKGKKKTKERSAGLLLHVSSLPSRFGIGDLGPGAYSFVDFLKRSKQRIWQLLPLNPVEEAQGNSPYSAVSSRAGNPLFVSPERLVEEGLLSEDDLENYVLPDTDKVEFEKVNRNKLALLRKAYATFCVHEEADPAFEEFCEFNREWLPDFTLYAVLKEQHNGLPWYQWTLSFRNRDEATLTQFMERNSERIRELTWIQYVFHKQWKLLRSYCNDQGIKIVGDIPIYVSYDSVDVWSHRSLFQVDEEGKMTGVAGVPPDSFTETGQLWGVPVFNWDELKRTNYAWWVNRLRKNTELFDLIRLDHFRAFADYWEVPGDRTTAEQGDWKEGPGVELFQAVQRALGSLPFIVEDLGKVSPAVIRLKDELRFPGMKVLHYAFEEKMAESDFIPHNYSTNCIVYTGTHDNNTTLGWFKEEVDEATRIRMESYLNQPVNETTVNEVIGRVAYASVAKMVILPVQDVLNLDSRAKMNRPGTNTGNWLWRLLPGQLTSIEEEMLRQWSELYGRA